MYLWKLLVLAILSGQLVTTVVGQESSTAGTQVITAACINAQTRLFQSERCGNAVLEISLVVSGLSTMVDEQSLSSVCTRNCINLATAVLNQCVEEDQRPRDMLIYDLACSHGGGATRCLNFLRSDEYQMLLSSFRDAGACNSVDTSSQCSEECGYVIGNFTDMAGCCARGLMEYSFLTEELQTAPTGDMGIFSLCDVEGPGLCTVGISETSGAITTKSIGIIGLLLAAVSSIGIIV